jgi:chromodomain-helicase-DNA-binding protein 7
MTGTPLQNNTRELWALLNYIDPIRFYDEEVFSEEFGKLNTEA